MQHRFALPTPTHGVRLTSLLRGDRRSVWATAASLGLIVSGFVGATRLMHTQPGLNIAALLYGLAAAWAEATVCPPRFAGWPSGLFLALTFVLLGGGPEFVVPVLLVALVVRLVRTNERAEVSREARWVLWEASVWIAATSFGADMAYRVRTALAISPNGSWLFSFQHFAVGTLAVGFSWAISVWIVSIILGTLAAKAGGFGIRDVALPVRMIRGALRLMALVGIAYIAIVATNISLGAALSAPVVTIAFMATVAGIARRAENKRQRLTMLQELAEQVEEKDAYSGDHVSSVAERTARVASEMALLADKVDEYATGALLHDIGKTAIGLTVLQRKGPLSDQEREQMQAHAAVGESILKQLPGMATAAAIAGGHHERWDGRGYPLKLAGTKIPLAARIVAVVDAFEAMTTDRPYRRAFSEEQVLTELGRGAGSQFDATVVAALTRQVARTRGGLQWQCFPLLDEV